jgi:hypothetical protein
MAQLNARNNTTRVRDNDKWHDAFKILLRLITKLKNDLKNV